MTDSSRNQKVDLAVEVLESRQMLSTVSIDAIGSTGEETMVVTAAGTEVFNTNVSAEGGTFTFEVDDSISASYRAHFGDGTLGQSH